MGRSFELQSLEQIEITAESLLRAAGNFSSTLQQMQTAGMTSAWIEWSRKHSNSLALLAEAGRAAATMIEGQVVSFRRGETSFYDLQAKKTERQTERARKKRAAESETSGSPPKKRGRPKKTT